MKLPLASLLATVLLRLLCIHTRAITVAWIHVSDGNVMLTARWSHQRINNLALINGWSVSSGVTNTNGVNYLSLASPKGNPFLRLAH